MLERARLAARRLLTVANLFENLCEAYGDRGALSASEPMGYRLFPSAAFSYRDCLRFTNLAAESLIRDLDLKKGERALLLISEPAQMLLAAVALIKAGGIAVPADASLPPEELEERARGVGASLALADGRLLADRPELAEGSVGVERLMASGPREAAPSGIPSLDAAMDASSGFFIPYTLKPANVVGLFHTVMGDGSLKAVMATNRMLLGPQRAASLVFPVRAGDTCLLALPLETMGGFSAALLALAMGLRLSFARDAGQEAALEAAREARPAAVMAAPGTCARLLEAGTAEGDLSGVRLWFCPGELPAGRPGRPGSRGTGGTGGRLSLVVEAHDAGGNAAMLALRPSLAGGKRPLRLPPVALPPNRMRTVDGEAAIKGPAVTPGYWNDLEGTLRAKRDGWLYTGVSG